jgi:pSer/pThr/pTyr-binding forkhead associated (FHA) protein
MSDETQYFDFGSSADPLAGVSSDAIASLVPKTPGQLRIDLVKEVCGVGRTDESDIVIPHRNVSKKHAELKKDGSMWELTDFGSTNGTFVNGSKVTGTVLISPNDTVSFGDQEYQFVVHDGTAPAPEMPASATGESPGVDAGAQQGQGAGMTAMFDSLFASGGSGGEAAGGGAAAPAAAPQAASASAPAAEPGEENKTMLRSYDFAESAQQNVFATLIEKSLSSRKFNLTQLRNRVGSAITNEVRIEDSSILNEHAEIIFEKDGRIRARSLDADVAIRINGEPVKAQFLKDLDTIQIGDIIYTFKVQNLPTAEDFEAAAAPKAVAAGGGGDKKKLILVGAVVALAAVAVLFVMQQGGGGEEVAGGAEVAVDVTQETIAAELAAQAKGEFDTVLSLFTKDKLIEARDRIEKLDQSDEEVKELAEAINIALRVQRAIDDEDVVTANREFRKLANSAYKTNNNIEKKQKALELLQLSKATDANDRAHREFTSGRYDEAAKYFERADQIKENFEGSADMAKVAKLADLLTATTSRAKELIRDEEFEQAEEQIQRALNAIEQHRLMQQAADIIKKYETPLENHLAFSEMKRLYRQGKGNEAIEAYEKTTEEFRAEERLTVFADRIKTVSKLAQEAVQEQSMEKASEVLKYEGDTENVYYQRANEIVQKLAAEYREQAQNFIDLARQELSSSTQPSTETYLKALQYYWRARQLDPTWDEPVGAHDNIGNRLLVEAYKLPGDGSFNQRKVEIYNWIMENSDPDDKVYKQAERQKKSILP